MSRSFLVPITLPADPANPLEAATKQYVDSKSAPSEVEISATEPTDPAVELWYDTGAGGGAAMAAEMQLWQWEGPAVTRYGATPLTLTNGQVSTNNAPSLATELYVSRLDATGMIDWSRPIEEAVIGDLVYLQHAPESASWHLYRITGTPTMAADGVWTIPVTTDSGSAPGTAPPTGDLVYIIFPSVYTDTRYVNVNGDAMTGALTLPAVDPTGTNDAARKAYVDTQVATRLTQAAADARYVNLVTTALQQVQGSFQATQVYVTTPPNGVNALTNKAYVDGAFVSKGGDTMTGGLTVSAGGVTGNRVDSNGAITAQASISTPAGAMTCGGDAVTAPGVSLISAGFFRNLVAGADAGTPSLRVCRSGNAGLAGEKFAQFLRRPAGTDVEIGSITEVGTTGVAYNTTSDYRMKEDHGPIPDGVDRLSRLRPIRFVWIDDPEFGEQDGFLAHEVDEVVPGAVSGVKDAVNDDGSIIPQQLDPARLVPLLVAAVQELTARVVELEAGKPPKPAGA